MNKDTQKQLITEVMNDDAKDGLYKPTTSKMEKAQTAVEWLINKIHSEQYQNAFGQTYISIELIQQAKTMEKEQIINARLDGFKISAEGWNGETPYEDRNDSYISKEIENEKYYKQTYE